MCRMQRLLLHWFHDHAHLIGQVANYSLIHSRTRKPIDLTAPFRFSGLSANSVLELVAHKGGNATVRVALQIPSTSGGRPVRFTVC